MRYKLFLSECQISKDDPSIIYTIGKKERLSSFASHFSVSKNGIEYEMKVCDGRKKDMDIKRVKKELAI